MCLLALLGKEGRKMEIRVRSKNSFKIWNKPDYDPSYNSWFGTTDRDATLLYLKYRIYLRSTLSRPD